MREAAVILTPVPQADGQVKHRPVIVLREMPRYHDALRRRQELRRRAKEIAWAGAGA